MSSEGTVRNAAGDTIKMELMDILKGKYPNPHVSIWYYKLDDISEVGRPEVWLKANPNLGKTVSYETYQLDVERMEHAPSQRNDILAKRFGIPMEGYTYFFTYEETLPTKRRNDFWLRDLEYPWKVSHSSSLMTKPSLRDFTVLRVCLALLVPTFRWAMTSAHSHLYFL